MGDDPEENVLTEDANLSGGGDFAESVGGRAAVGAGVAADDARQRQVAVGGHVEALPLHRPVVEGPGDVGPRAAHHVAAQQTRLALGNVQILRQLHETRLDCISIESRSITNYRDRSNCGVTFDVGRGLHFHLAGLDFAGRALGHALVRAGVVVGGVLDHQRAVAQHLVARVVLGVDLVAVANTQTNRSGKPRYCKRTSLLFSLPSNGRPATRRLAIERTKLRLRLGDKL